MKQKMRKTAKSRQQRAIQKAKKEQARSLKRRENAEQKRALSRQLESGVSLSHEARAVSLFNALDGYAGLRNGLRTLANDREEWAGYPLPLGDGYPLVVEPTYPRAEQIMAIGRKPPEEIPEGTKIRNTFWSWRWRTEVVIWEENGKIEWGPLGTSNQLGMLLNTLGASDAWGIEQEAAAVQTLGTLIRHRQFKQYLQTGMFMERSPRSHVSYLFRRLRPTIAISSNSGTAKALCALCLHPIGYYDGSWAGAMTPTDDVIAHLSLMRGDEAMLWRRANQHPSYRKEAGIG